MQRTNRVAVHEGAQGSQKRDRRRAGRVHKAQKAQGGPVQVELKSDWSENSHVPNSCDKHLNTSPNQKRSKYKCQVKHLRKFPKENCQK